jgi:hypothetical protein
MRTASFASTPPALRGAQTPGTPSCSGTLTFRPVLWEPAIHGGPKTHQTSIVLFAAAVVAVRIVDAPESAGQAAARCLRFSHMPLLESCDPFAFVGSCTLCRALLMKAPPGSQTWPSRGG